MASRIRLFFQSFRKREFDSRMNDELQSHLAARAAELDTTGFRARKRSGVRGWSLAECKNIPSKCASLADFRNGWKRFFRICDSGCECCGRIPDSRLWRFSRSRWASAQTQRFSASWMRCCCGRCNFNRQNNWYA